MSQFVRPRFNTARLLSKRCIATTPNPASRPARLGPGKRALILRVPAAAPTTWCPNAAMALHPQHHPPCRSLATSFTSDEEASRCRCRCRRRGSPCHLRAVSVFAGGCHVAASASGGGKSNWRGRAARTTRETAKIKFGWCEETNVIPTSRCSASSSSSTSCSLHFFVVHRWSMVFDE
jgi:hypothetical protein